MIKEIVNFERRELFNIYNGADNPFLSITTKIDVTNIVRYCQVHKNFYATMGYLLTRAVNKVDALKYRAQGEKIYFCDRIKSNYTQKIDDNTIGFFDLPDIEQYHDYLNEYQARNHKLINEKCNIKTEGIDCVWFSCIPWFEFTGIITPFRKSVSIPQFIWDKFTEENGKYTIHLMIMAHHGFVDGWHVSKLLECFKQEILAFA
ncbi:MAG: hypothetical protein J5598_00265 [Clostridia bacterium]|nr:hypothetical protein [Clostridia bacterium]